MGCGWASAYNREAGGAGYCSAVAHRTRLQDEAALIRSEGECCCWVVGGGGECRAEIVPPLGEINRCCKTYGIWYQKTKRIAASRPVGLHCRTSLYARGGVDGGRRQAEEQTISNDGKQQSILVVGRTDGLSTAFLVMQPNDGKYTWADCSQALEIPNCSMEPCALPLPWTEDAVFCEQRNQRSDIVWVSYQSRYYLAKGMTGG